MLVDAIGRRCPMSGSRSLEIKITAVSNDGGSARGSVQIIAGGNGYKEWSCMSYAQQRCLRALLTPAATYQTTGGRPLTAQNISVSHLRRGALTASGSSLHSLSARSGGCTSGMQLKLKLGTHRDQAVAAGATEALHDWLHNTHMKGYCVPSSRVLQEVLTQHTTI